MVPSAALSLLLLGLLVPLVKSDPQICTPDETLPGCKAKCPGDLTIDISQTFSYPVKGIASDSPDNTFSYDCHGGLYCKDNTDNNFTAVCQNDQIYRGLATVNVVTWTLIQTNPLVFTVEYAGAEQGEGGINQPSIFLYSEVSGSGTPTVAYNESDPKLTFHVTGDCVTISCEGGGDVAGPIGLALISLAILALITYFIVGSLVMYFARGARGIEVIPNIMFWKDFPFLLMDGALFMISPCYKRSSDYEKI